MSQEIAPQEKKPTKAMTLAHSLESYRHEIMRALPRHVSPDRMLRMALTSARKNPELLNCDQTSFLGAVVQAAQLGLEPDTVLGQCYLIPFNNNKTGKKEVNFMPGYRGYMDLIYRVPKHPILTPVVVHEGDEFDYERGLTPKLFHKPMPHDARPKLTHVYCVASFPDGRKEFDIMTRQEIEERRARSKALKFSPWNTDYDAMAMKSVIRRMSKFLPMSAEINMMVGFDDKIDANESQHNSHVILQDHPIHTKVERVEKRMSDPDDFENFDK